MPLGQTCAFLNGSGSLHFHWYSSPLELTATSSENMAPMLTNFTPSWERIERFQYILCEGQRGSSKQPLDWKNQLQRAFKRLNLQPLALLTLSGHHWSSSPKETGLCTGMLFLSKLASPSRLVEPRSVSNEAPSSHRRSRNLNTDSRSRNSSESRSKGRRRTGMQ